MNSTKTSPRNAARTTSWRAKGSGKVKRTDKIKRVTKMRKVARFAGKKVAEGKRVVEITTSGDQIKIKVIQKAGRNAASRAMKVMGYVVVQEGNKIVKRYRDGRIDELEDLGMDRKVQTISFD